MSLISQSDSLNVIADTLSVHESVSELVSDTLEGVQSELMEPVTEYVDAVGMFGEQTVLVSTDIPDAVLQGTLLTDSVCFNVLLLSCFCALCLFVLLYKGQIRDLFNIFRGRNYVERLLDTQNYLFDRFVKLSLVLGFVVSGIGTVKGFEMLAPAEVIESLPMWLRSLLAPILSAVLLFIYGIQIVLMRAGGRITYQEELLGVAVKIKRMVMAVGALLITPPILLIALSSGTPMYLFIAVLLLVLIALSGFFIIKTLMLFVDRKISIFYWILYLCAVEIFPISLLVLWAQRSM